MTDTPTPDDTPTTDDTPDEETGVPAGDEARPRSPGGTTSGSADPEGGRRVDPDSPGETLDDADIAEPNEPG